MRSVVVAVRAGCFVLGIMLLGFALVGLADQIQHSGEKRRVGSGAYAMDMPATTVFQEMDVTLYGIWGSVLIAASMGCEGVLRLHVLNDTINKGISKMEQLRNEDAPKRVQIVQPATISNED
ncbi:MAG TPA: hypothetical protein VHU84_17375, partial [Lacipirellulaceae bacterium]|nr:hypothetical protein [Lacipirellulaceae bacterium]